MRTKLFIAYGMIVVGAAVDIANVVWVGSNLELLLGCQLILYSSLFWSFSLQRRLTRARRVRLPEIPSATEWAAASARASELLTRHLTPEQREDWYYRRCIVVRSPSGRVWRLSAGWAGNIQLIAGPSCRIRSKRIISPSGGDRDIMCVHIRHPEYACTLLPVEDNILGQKLMLETVEGEKEMIRRAY